MEHQEIIDWLWRRQAGEYAFASTRLNGRWKDHAHNTMDELSWDQFNPAADLFFTPLTFTEPQRSNETVTMARCLFADLDPVDPSSLSIRPSLAWETSPGNFQAIWLVVDEMPYSLFANLNRRLTMLTGADPGGWMGSKVLRVPGSMNHKYSPSRPGRLLWWEPQLLYWTGELHDHMPALPNRPDVGVGNYPEIIDSSKSDEFIRDRWEGMTLRARSMLMESDNVGDRSLYIVTVIHELLKTGVSTNTVFNLIWWRPWNKWRLNGKPEQLWAEINRAKMRLFD